MESKVPTAIKVNSSSSSSSSSSSNSIKTSSSIGNNHESAGAKLNLDAFKVTSPKHGPEVFSPVRDYAGVDFDPLHELHPLDPFVSPMLTDLYQLTMAYAYWKNDRHNEDCVFDLFFRVNPFHGEFTIFAGLDEVIRYVSAFKFTEQDIAELKERFPNWEEGFLDYLRKLDGSTMKLYAIREGTLVFPRLPLIRVEGPLGLCQLVETTMLVLVNFASLIATNAARHRLAAGKDKSLLEFGLRRAQGPDGAMTASKYAYLGGFDGTSNVRAGLLYNIPLRGTHAHSFVASFTGLKDLVDTTLKCPDGTQKEFAQLAVNWRNKLKCNQSNLGELAAFISYGQAYPSTFLALVDTYDTLGSGVWNFLCVALALIELGYKPVGIRLDSGDLSYLSVEARKLFTTVAETYKVDFSKLTIVASNDLDENVLWSLREQGHSIDAFGIGTNLVTCKAQPALGCVYKLVEVHGEPRIKLSQDVVKVTLPGRKEAWRLYNDKNEPVLDLLVLVGSAKPQANRKILCRHPFDEKKRAYVIPAIVQPLHILWWSEGKLVEKLPTLEESKAHAAAQLAAFRPDHLRRLNPTPYKVSVSSDLFTFLHDLWLNESPIAELS